MYMIIGVALVVAVITSIITVSITGNVIKVQQTKIGTDVYTKAEVDTLLQNLNSNIRYGVNSVTYDMLVRLDKCTVVKDRQSSGIISCDTICAKTGNMTCVLGEYQGIIRPCNDFAGSINTDRFCKCCGL